MKQEDIQIHRTRNNPKCATVVIMDMSGSMRYGELYVSCKIEREVMEIEENLTEVRVALSR